MKRNFEEIIAREWDVLVIGGGITGVGVAWEAASRGLSVALIEKSDFGGAASSGCFRIIHGGIRYLQHLDFFRLLESANEQAFLRRSAPHLVHPFPFLVPCYKSLKKSRSYVGLGALLYDLITFNRNRYTDREHLLPHPRIITRNEVLSIAPKLPSEGLTGGVIFYDCSVYHCERLTLGIMESATLNGARVANYTEVVDTSIEITEHTKKISKIKIKDLISGKEGFTKARILVNAAGPWIPSLNKHIFKDQYHEKIIPKTAYTKLYSKGVQLVLPNIIQDCALAIASSQNDYSAVVNRGTRSYFLLPWRNATLLGTSEQLFSGDPGDYEITKDDIENLLTDARRAYPSELLTIKNVKHVFGGLRQLDPAFFTQGQLLGEAPPSKIDQLIDYAELKPAEGNDPPSSIDNLISVACVKYTTFRAVAERAINLVETKLQRRRSTSTSSNTMIAGGVDNWIEFQSMVKNRLGHKLKESCLNRIIREFGSKTMTIADMIDNDHTLSNCINGSDITKAEVILSLRTEIPVMLTDIILRRTSLGAYGYPGKHAVESVADICAEDLNWNLDEKQENIHHCEKELSILLR